MRNYRKSFFLLLWFFILFLSLSLFPACGKPGFTTYTNNVGGYTIKYPYSWKLEVTEDKTICVMTAPSRRGSIRIDVMGPMLAEEAAKRWLIAIGTAFGEVTQFENKSMDGFWDWYLSYEYEGEFSFFRGEAYFKQTPKHLYKIDTLAEKYGYDGYPFAAILSSFKLLRK